MISDDWSNATSLFLSTQNTPTNKITVPVFFFSPSVLVAHGATKQRLRREERTSVDKIPSLFSFSPLGGFLT